MSTSLDFRKLPLITLIVYISSLWHTTHQQPVAQNFGDFDSFAPFQQFGQFQQFRQAPALQNFPPQQNFNQNFNQNFPPQQNFNRNLNQNFNQNFPPQQNFNQNLNQNLRSDNRLSFGQNPVFATTTSAPTTAAPVVIVNNQPAVPTMVPFIRAATTPTPEFLNCFSSCPTTSEFNPVCASNREQYGNEQKFICAQRCGADIQIVRRGSCQGLFPIARG